MPDVAADAFSNDWIYGGEPPYRAVRHERLMQGLPSVALHLEGYVGSACLLTVGLAQGRDEKVVDVSVIGMVCYREKLAHGFSV